MASGELSIYVDDRNNIFQWIFAFIYAKIDREKATAGYIKNVYYRLSKSERWQRLDK